MSKALKAACVEMIGVLKTVGLTAPQHAVMGQTRLNRATGEAERVVMVHIHPSAPVPGFALPEEIGGFPVELHDWPNADLMGG